MAYPIPTVKAMRAAERALAELHKKWSDPKARYDLTGFARAVRAYIASAEDAMLAGDPPAFEIRAAESVTGRPEVVYLDEADFEWI